MENKIKKEIRKEKEWKCEKVRNKIIMCESRRGNMVSLHEDGSVRFTKEDNPVRVNGKWIKEKGDVLLGVELN